MLIPALSCCCLGMQERPPSSECELRAREEAAPTEEAGSRTSSSSRLMHTAL